MNAPLLPALPGYENPELIAHGTTALVFRAIQTTLNRAVAIKVITVDTGSIPVNAARELATTVALSSQPHIVSIIDTGVTDDDRPYIVMEYCEGGSYAGILRQNGPLPLDDVIEVGVKIGEALHAAHQAGIVHRDVKPSNILRSRFGPALTDFGIARAPDELGNTLTRELMTPHHASPEALLHQAQSGISDVYSLASTMWTLLVGHPPFVDPRNPTMDMYAFRDRVLHDELPPMSRDGVPQWLVAELRKAMSKLPAARHASALDFAQSLRRGSLGLDPSARSPVPRVEPASPSPPASSRLVDAANAAGSPTFGQPSALGQPSTFVPPTPSPVPTPYVPPSVRAAVGSAPVTPPVTPSERPEHGRSEPGRSEPGRSEPGASESAPQPTPGPTGPGPWGSAPVRHGDGADLGPRPSEPRESGGSTTGGSTGRSANPMRAPVIPPLPAGPARPRTGPSTRSAAAYAGPTQTPAPAPATPSTTAPTAATPSTTAPTSAPRPAPEAPPSPRPGADPGPKPATAPGPGPRPTSWPGPTNALASPASPAAADEADEFVGGWPPPPPGVPGSRGRNEGGWLGSQAAPTRARPAPERPEALVAPPGSRGSLLVVLVVLAVMAIVGAGILLAVNKGRTGIPAGAEGPDTASPQATKFITATKQDAPRNVRIVDQRGTTLTVTWTDPSNGTVSFVVNGKGPNDERLDPKYLDRGMTSVTFVGLSPAKNYCFLVAAVYSSDHIAVADETCTKR
jgi:serine/threonine protein kinase